MADSQSPIICVTCQRSLPDGLKADDSPRYFAQYHLLQKTDSDSDFVSEARRITEFINAVAEALRFSQKEIEEKTYNTLFDLIAELSEEALRRMRLSLDAMDEIWKRDHDKDALTRKEGRA